MNADKFQEYCDFSKELKDYVGADNLNIALYGETVCEEVRMPEHFSIWASINGSNGKATETFSSSAYADRGGKELLKSANDIKRQIEAFKNNNLKAASNGH